MKTTNDIQFKKDWQQKVTAPGRYYPANFNAIHGGRLGLRVSKSKQAWFIDFRYQKKRQTHTFKESMSYKEAATATINFMEDIGKGIDPRMVARQKELTAVKESSQNVNAMWLQYMDTPKFRGKKPVTQKEDIRKWNMEITPLIGSLPVKEVTPVMLNNILKDKAKVAPVSANRLYSLLRVAFRPAVQLGWIVHNPVVALDRPSNETSRKRTLSDEEIVKVWQGMDVVSNNAERLLKLILLTCQRPGEVASMKYEDIIDGVWHQTENKTGTINLVPLSEPALELIGDGTGFVFASNYGRCGHARPSNKDRVKIWKQSGVTDWTAHDLRRTGRTLMSRLQIKHHIRERVLGHSQGGVVGVYDQHDYLQEKASALRKLGREVNRILGKAQQNNIIPLQQTA